MGRVLRGLLAALLEDAARTLHAGPDADAQALALHLVALDGPHRSAWSKLAPLTCPPAERAEARRLVADLLRGAHAEG